MRRLALLVLMLSLTAGPFAAEASANRLSLSRAKRVAGAAVQRDFGLRVRIRQCSPRNLHRVTCSFPDVAVGGNEGEGLNALPETCGGSVVVVLGHRTGRVRSSTGGVVCGASAAPSPDDLPGAEEPPGGPGATGTPVGPDAGTTGP
jgi:hypothetical protein